MVESLYRNKDYQLAGVDIVPPKERFDGVEYHTCDLVAMGELYTKRILRDFAPDTIVHLAAQPRVDPSVKDPFATYDTNVLATLNLAKEIGSQNPPPLFVYASSEAVYGKARVYPTPENNDFNPASPYASSKIASDVMVQQLNGRNGMRTCVLRSGMGMGPRSNPKEQVVSKFILKALKAQPLMFPAGDVVHPTRDINPVQNFAQGVRLALEAKAQGVYNIASGRELSILEVAKKVLDEVGRRKVEDTSDLLKFSPDFTYRDNEEGMRTWLDISKARRDLGYDPKVTFEAALPSTIEWLENNAETYWGRQ